MYKKLNQSGRSMIEMLGVLAIIGILTLASFAGYQKAVTKARLNDSVRSVAMVLQNYADLLLRNPRGLNITGTDAVEKAILAGLNSECRPLESETDEGYQVCDVPLGEMYMKFTDFESKQHSFMLFLTMVDETPDTCTAFLSQGWEEIIPQEWWTNGMIWLKSDNKEKVVYAEGGNPNLTRGEIATACQAGCPKDSGYCSVIFDFGSSY